MTQVDGAQVQLSTAQKCLLLNYHPEQLEPHINRKGDDQPKWSERRNPDFVALDSLSR